MSFLSWLLGKKSEKLGSDDGQDKYFKEDFDPRDGRKAPQKVEKTVEEVAKPQVVKDKPKESNIKAKVENVAPKSSIRS